MRAPATAMSALLAVGMYTIPERTEVFARRFRWRNYCLFTYDLIRLKGKEQRSEHVHCK
jgi:hypothetical protein